MNQHNFLQFNPNSYKKHLSPFGRTVLNTLIKHWRTGFDNNENRRRQPFTTNQNRRQYTREFNDYPRSVPSIPSVSSVSPSPRGEISDERGISRTTNNFDTYNHVIPQLPATKGPFSSTTGVVSNTSNYGTEINEVPRFNDDNFAIPSRSSAGKACKPSTTIDKNYREHYLYQTKHIADRNTLLQQHGIPCNQMQNVLAEAAKIHAPLVRDEPICEVTNEPVLTSHDLANTVEIHNTNEEEILTANDTVTPVTNFHNIHEKLISSKKYIDTDMQAKSFLTILNQNANDKYDTMTNESAIVRNEIVEKNVDWNDMFDTELLPDLNNQQLIRPLKDAVDKFMIEFPKDKKKKQKQTLNNKVTKRKYQIKHDNISTKKMICKKSIEGKLSTKSRKAKYTKAVKTWLDDVSGNNIVEDDIDRLGANDIPEPRVVKAFEINVNKSVCDSNAIIETTAIETNKKPVAKNIVKTSELLLKSLDNAEEELQKGLQDVTNKINHPTVLDKHVTVKNSSSVVIEKRTKANNKKVIQARLAEKDGKMKFGLPKEQNQSKTEIALDNDIKNKQAVKEKKAKSKFMPRIKSQIPVKNVTFDVNTINDRNLQLIRDVMLSEENDIAVILIYKNGFCQLNNHHTEDNCISEGIMVQIHERFYYFKDLEQNSDIFMPLLENSQVICYNGKQLLMYLISKNVKIHQDVLNLFDAKIGGSVIDPDNPPENFAELQKLLEFTPEYTIATECPLQKAAWYLSLLRDCYVKLKSLLTDNSVWNVFVEIEMPLLPIIAGMEYRGVSVDLAKLKSMEDTLLTKMNAVEQECYKAAGKTFQINSTVQVRTILYDELQLDTKSNLKIKETIGKGAKSTSETMLRGLVTVHPLPRLILEYRHLHKAHATFLTGIAQHVKDGSVKPTWVQMAAATGRIASNNPNLQAIPKAPFSLVVFPESCNDQEPTLNFRSVYLARPGHSFVAADFKHIECRVFAHAAEDATLQDALRSDQDLFRVLAAKWISKPLEEVSTEDRERTKRIVYASLYGAGARKLMEILHISYEQALGVTSSFNRTFPALKSFGRAVIAKAASGALRTLCGRARNFPQINSADAGLKAQAERQAVNFVVQGSAADLCKKAMVAVQRRLESAAIACRLVLQIHDELVWELEDDQIGDAAAIIKDAMENVGRAAGMGMGMTLPVELTRGRNWGEMQPLQT